MNAKITITVPMEEIPGAVSKYLNEILEKFNNILENISYISIDVKEENDLVSQIQSLEEIRKKLSTLDLNLEDCYSILKGYTSYKLDPQKKEEVANDIPDA